MEAAQARRRAAEGSPPLQQIAASAAPIGIGPFSASAAAAAESSGGGFLIALGCSWKHWTLRRRRPAQQHPPLPPLKAASRGLESWKQLIGETRVLTAAH